MIQKTEQEIIENWKGKIDSPIVSICCITYNHEAYITEAIEGFLIQETNFPFEILIRDDCSTDNTKYIIQEYVKQYPNLIKPIFEKENTFSKGIKPLPQVYENAKGKYIAICEGDDYWTDPSKLQKQVNFLQENPLYAACFHDSLILNETQDSNKTQHIKIGDRKIDEDVDIVSIIKENNIATASIVFKNSIRKTPKYHYKTTKGDYALMVNIASQGTIKYLPEVMSAYRVHGGGVWSSQSEIYKEKENLNFYSLLQNHFSNNSHTLQAINKKKKYVYYSLARKLVYKKQRIKSFYYILLSLDFFHYKHPKIKFYIYFKEFIRSMIK